MPAPRSDVNVCIVEKQPHFGLFCGGYPGRRFVLDEVADRFNQLIEGFVEFAVHVQCRGESHGSYRRLAGAIPRLRRRQDGWWWNNRCVGAEGGSGKEGAV